MNRFPLALSAILLLCTAAHAQDCATVEVHNVRPQQGQLMLAAYADAETFGKNPLKMMRVPAGDATMTVQFCGLTGSAVALMLYQDLDGDGKMGRNAVGIPSEPWGGSGTPGMFGPRWETGRVALDGKPIVVRLSM
ncbi:MAG: DUF2141 domain-containing protein [Rubrivivax sp.]|nr:DUF2141 domain-containing protein [Rubrivivax sp.]MDP3615251.1 DUF2141 domain-containing protein [Rubrivivax sp.]